MLSPKPSPERHDDLSMLAAMTEIPPHDPTRYQTTDGLDNPSCANGDRASFAAEALATFQKSCGMTEHLETAAADLICDLLHLIHADNCESLSAIHSGIQSFLCEAGNINSSV